jgi:glycosyltransferase involved in cell wall biosynthesis
MSLDRLFVIVPSLVPTGPIKGAVALCNGLAGQLPVTLVTVKGGSGLGLSISSDVERLSLAHLPGTRVKINALRRALQEAGGREKVASLSFCLSADALNLFMRGRAHICSSVRGNLPANYRFDYGWAGLPLAWAHLLALHFFDRVVAMSETMARQLRRFGLGRIAIASNFVDEGELRRFRFPEPEPGRRTRFLFLASLSRRKRPELLLESAAALAASGVEFQIEFAGEGVLDEQLKSRAFDLGLSDNVVFHGQLEHPYELLQEVDYMVLPSESEGVPRAAMEALFFGVPCILRNVDANRELVSPGYNGALFDRDSQLADILLQAVAERGNYRPRRNLLPELFRQPRNVALYLQSLDKNG